MRLLVTGFPPFAGRPSNPSQDLILLLQAQGLNLPNVLLRAELLPVEYAGVEDAFCRSLLEFEPDVCLSFGVGRGIVPLQLERTGRNVDDCELPDNSGEIRCGSLINPSGPSFFASPIDLLELQRVCCENGFPTQVSDDAGKYVCNHLLYFGLQAASETQSGCRFVFTHLAPEEHGLPTSMLQQAVQCMAKWFQCQLSAEKALI